MRTFVIFLATLGCSNVVLAEGALSVPHLIAPALLGAAGENRLTAEINAPSTYQQNLEKCMKEMDVYWHKDKATGTVMIAGTKRDTLNTDFYLFLTPNGIHRLDTSTLPKARPVSFKLKAGDWETYAYISDNKYLPDWDKNSLLISISKPDPKIDKVDRGPLHEITIPKAEWNEDLEKFAESHITESYRTGIGNAAALSLLPIYIDRQKKDKEEQKQDEEWVTEQLDRANAENAKVYDDYREKKIDEKTWKERAEKTHQERMKWVRIQGAMALRVYSQSAKKLEDTERDRALGILHNGEKTRFPALLRAYPACREVLKNSGRDIFRNQKDEQGLIEFMRKEFAKVPGA